MIIWMGHLVTRSIVLVRSSSSIDEFRAFLVDLTLNSALDLAVHAFNLFMNLSVPIVTIGLCRRLLIKIIIFLFALIRFLEKF